MRESRSRGSDKSDSKVFKHDIKKCNKLKDINRKKNVGNDKKASGEVESAPLEIEMDSGDLSTRICNSPVKSEYSEEGSGTDLSASSSNARGNGSQTSGSRTNQFASAPTKKQGISGIKFQPGIRLEAKDLGNGIWYAVKVVEVDWEEEEILIHFEKWSQRYDEWIPMDSSRLRPALEPPGGFVKKTSKIFKVGDKVMATWSDSRKYPATVKTVLANDRYEVLFFDGFSKNIKGGRMILLKDEELAKIQELQPGIGPSNDVTNTISRVTDSVLQMNSAQMASTLGTKEERRERKRKLNVAELFHFKKRPRLDSTTVQTSVDVVKKARRGSGFGNKGKKKGLWSEEMPGVGVGYPNLEQMKVEPHFPETSQEKPLDNVDGNGVVAVENKKKEYLSKTKGKSKLDDFERTVKRSRVDGSLQRIEESKIDCARKLGRKLSKYRDVGRKHLSVSRKEKGIEELDMRGKKKEEGDTSKPARHIDDWEPIGEPAYIVDGTDGPRKSIIVADPRIPAGWTRHTIQRMSGHSAGKWDVFFVCPEGRKFRTRHELRTYYEEHGETFPSEQFDFSLGRRKNKAVAEREGNSAVSTTSFIGSSSSLSKIGRLQSPASSHMPISTTLSESGNDTPVRRVKTLLPRVRPPNIEGTSSSVPQLPSVHEVFDDSSVTSHGSVVLGGLKIQKENDAFRCPKEGCNKNFRKENLLQMHMKHYHPEYNRFVASTPNVADLAYARTVGEPLEELHSRTPRPSFLDKISRFEALRRARAVNTESGSSPTSMSPSLQSATSVVTSQSSIVSTPASLQPIAPRNVTSGGRRLVGETDLSEDASLIEATEAAVPSSPLSSTDVTETCQTTVHTIVPTGRSTSTEIILHTKQSDADGEETPVLGELCLPLPSSETILVSETKMEERNSDVQNISTSLSTAGVSHTKSLRLVRRRHMSDFHMEPLMKKRKSEMEEPNQNATSTSTASRQTRTESLRREELINCTCGYPEEDGLMIQCDLCMCWQHGLCNNIEHEDHVPEKYVCFICQHPPRERQSKHFLHDQDWLKEGKLPSLSFRSKNTTHMVQCENIFKRSHGLASSLLQLQNLVHSLRVKVNIATKTDHPKLYLWAHSWERTLPQNQSAGDLLRHKDVFKLTKDPVVEDKQKISEGEILSEDSKKQHDLPLPISYDGAICDADCDVADPSADLVGEAGGIPLGSDSVDLLADESDTKDTCFSQETIYSTKEVQGVQIKGKKSLIERKSDLPDLPEAVVLERGMDIGTETEVTTASGDADQEGNITVKDDDINGVDEKKSNNMAETFSKDGSIQKETSSATLHLTMADKSSVSDRTKTDDIEDEDLQLPLCQTEVIDSSLPNKTTPLEDSRIVDMEFSRKLVPCAPQPEAPIDPAECQLTLLDHIEHLHQHIESRLTSLETHIAGLEIMDTYHGHDKGTDLRTKETVQMLLRDLSALYDVAAFN